MREIPKKNYIIMIFITLSVVIVTIALGNAYNNREKKTSDIYSFLSEIKVNDLDTYLLENPNAIIYISDKYDLNNEKIEETIKKDITELNVKDYFVYLDTNDITESFLKNFNEKYDGNIDIDKIPMIVIISDGKVVNCYYDIDTFKLTEIIGDVK